jgi:NitT/TauT family transport system permease protein
MKQAPILAFIVACVIWETATRFFEVPRYIFPSLSTVMFELADHFGLVAKNTGVTALESLFGALIGCAVGFTLGSLMALNRWARSVLLPYVVGSNSVPIVAIAPLVALWFGHGLLPKVVVAAFLCFFPIAINTYDGLRDRGGVFKELFTVIGASSEFYFWNLRMPLAVPYIVAGAKVSAVLAVIGAVVAEFVGSDAGLGFGMVQATYSLDTPRLFGYMIVACALGLLFYGLVVVGELLLKRSGRWDWAFGAHEEALND